MRVRILVLVALCGLLGTGCSSPLVFQEDTQWPSVKEARAMGIEQIKLTSSVEKTPWFAPLGKACNTPFMHEAAIERIVQNKDGYPEVQIKDGYFGLIQYMKEEPWFKSTGEPDYVWCEVFTGRLNSIELLTLGSMSADQFGHSVIERNSLDRTWKLVEKPNTRRFFFTAVGSLPSFR